MRSPRGEHVEDVTLIWPCFGLAVGRLCTSGSQYHTCVVAAVCWITHQQFETHCSHCYLLHSSSPVYDSRRWSCHLSTAALRCRLTLDVFVVNTRMTDTWQAVSRHQRANMVAWRMVQSCSGRTAHFWYSILDIGLLRSTLSLSCHTLARESEGKMFRFALNADFTVMM